MGGFAGEEQAVVVGPGERGARIGLARQGVAVAAADAGGTGPVGGGERTQTGAHAAEQAASWSMARAKAASLPFAGLAAPAPPRKHSMTGRPKGRM